jgi:hypothetical protein
MLQFFCLIWLWSFMAQNQNSDFCLPIMDQDINVTDFPFGLAVTISHIS